MQLVPLFSLRIRGLFETFETFILRLSENAVAGALLFETEVHGVDSEIYYPDRQRSAANEDYGNVNRSGIARALINYSINPQLFCSVVGWRSRRLV